MKPILFATLFTLITGISLSTKAQTIYNISSNVSTSSFGSGVICTNCKIVISPGVTVTIDNNASCNTCTFTGGTISIVPGSSFTLSGVDSFKNETVLVGQSFNMSTLVFYGDTVAFNTSMNLSGGRTDIDSSRVSVNAALTLNKGTIYKDSLHVNSNLTFTNSVDSFAYSNITVKSGATISTNQSNFISSTFAFNGSSSMSVNNGMTSTGSNYYLGGTSGITSSTTSLSNDNVVMNGSTNSFSTTNGLTTSNTNITMNSSTSSTLTASSLTASGGNFNATAGTAGASINITNAISLTNINATLTGATFKGNSLTTSGGLFSLSNATATITNADNFSGTAVTMTNSSLTGNSGGLSTGATLTMNGTSSISVTNGFNVAGSQALLYGNSTLSSGSMAISGSTWFKIGDGTIGSLANVSVTNAFSVDNTSTMGISNNKNYLNTSNATLKTNVISCGGGGTQHACATGFVYGCGTISNNIGSPCIVLGLASITLSAKDAGPGQVALNWTDNGTGAADHYTIQRSTGSNDWTTIGTITSGNATGNYYFRDADAPAGTIDYRIERTDADGRTLYSGVSSVTLDQAISGVSIHPNPATGGTAYITTPYTSEMIVNVFTLTGQLLQHTSLKGQTQYPIRLPSTSLSLGTVVVQTIGQAGTRTFTLLVR